MRSTFFWSIATLSLLSLHGCDGGESTGAGGGGAAGAGGTGGTGSTTDTSTASGGGLPAAPCKQGNIVLQGTLDGQDVTIDVPKISWDYKGPGTDFVVSFEAGSVGLKTMTAGGDDSGTLPVTGGLDLPPALPHGNDILCIDAGTMKVCDGGGFSACADKTYQFQLDFTTITKTTGGTCGVKPSKKQPVAGELVGCLLDKL